MGIISSTEEQQQFVLDMVCEYGCNWYVLELPDGRYGALWNQGLEIEHAVWINEGEYDRACAFLSYEKLEVIAYCIKSWEEEESCWAGEFGFDEKTTKQSGVNRFRRMLAAG